MEEQNQAQTIKRPWQGLALVIINILGILYLIYSVIFASSIYKEDITRQFEGMDMYNVSMSDQDMQNMITITIAVVVAILIFVIILNTILTIGFYKGWKWALITNIVFLVLTIIFSLPALLASNYNLVFILFNFVIMIFELYLSIVCLQEPFYNKKK